MAIIGTILTADFESDILGPVGHRMSAPLDVSQTIYAGALFYLAASGYARSVPASDGSTNLSTFKVFQNYGPAVGPGTGVETVVGQYDHIASLDNLSGTDLAIDDVGKKIYAVSDHEVVDDATNGSGSNPPVGTLIGLSSDRVKAYVHVTPHVPLV
jgi:hypothetical protein